MRFSEIYPYNWEMYNDLNILMYDFKIYPEVYENLYEVFNVEDQFNLPFVSKATKLELIRFRDKWYSFCKKYKFSNDHILAYSHPEFEPILDNYLLPFIKSFNNDLVNANSEEDIFKIKKNRILPTKEEILKRIYQVL